MLLRFILLALLFSVQALFSDTIFPCGGRSSYWQSWVCILTFVTLRVPAIPRLKLIGVICPSLNQPYDSGWLGLGLRPTLRAWGWAQSDWRFWKIEGRHHNKRNGGWARKTALTNRPPGLPPPRPWSTGHLLFPDHARHLLVLLLASASASASACSPWNSLPFICLANSYSPTNTLLKYHLLLKAS